MALLFFDIDGTIWDFHNVIPESTKTALRLLRENGHKAFICSGRTKVFLRDPKLKALDFDGLLGGCGTEIEYEGEELLCKTIEPDLMMRALRIFDSYGMGVMMESRDILYMDKDKIGRDDYGKYIIKTMGDVIRPLPDSGEEADACKFTVLIEGADYRKVTETLQDDFEVMVHGGYVMELVPKGFSKATGIAFLCERLGVERADTFSFGDGVNDLEMLDYAGVGIAMGNAVDDAKAQADYVTDDIHEDGIYNACKKFGLI